MIVDVLFVLNILYFSSVQANYAKDSAILSPLIQPSERVCRPGNFKIFFDFKKIYFIFQKIYFFFLGFLGTNCEIECGITFAQQNQKIIGGII
jgi:hypothetical protein